jgi:L-asparaginase
MPTVRVLSCGGTIASEPSEAGAAPTKRGAELIEAVPELAGHADVSADEVASRPGFDVDFRTVAALAEAARAAAREVDGIVVTHGTDTLADAAYALDLATSVSVPVVVTGSQRRFDEPGTDAPSNLLTAVRAAADSRFAGGVFVAFDDELHAARDAVKTHTNALSTFASPGKGPVATFTRATVRIHREPRSGADSVPTADPDEFAAADVGVVHSGIGVGRRALDLLVDAGVDGVVVEGTGLGNATGDLGDAIADAVEEIPIVVSSRCHAGPTEPVYGTRGGAVTLRAHGAHFAGDLPTSKARVKLALALTAGYSRRKIASLFE